MMDFPWKKGAEPMKGKNCKLIVARPAPVAFGTTQKQLLITWLVNI